MRVERIPGVADIIHLDDKPRAEAPVVCDVERKERWKTGIAVVLGVAAALAFILCCIGVAHAQAPSYTPYPPSTPTTLPAPSQTITAGASATATWSGVGYVGIPGAPCEWCSGTGLAPFAPCSPPAQRSISMSIRCKMQLESVIPLTWGGSQAIFRCRYDQRLCEEDVSFEKATPSGEARFQIDNPKAREQLTIGKHYYVDFSPAD